MPEPIVPTLVDSVPEVAPVATPETPSTDVVPETPPASPAQEPEIKTPAEQDLFELPDGRKVDGKTLAREWKENFYPDYTRKSQELAKSKKVETHINKEGAPNEPAWKRPDYEPKTYAEIIEAAKSLTIDTLRAEREAEQEQMQRVTQEIDSTITELKAADATLDENSLFQHATKYGFRDLRQAYANMKDMRAVEKQVEQRVVQNIKARGTDPVSGGQAPKDSGVDIANISNFRSAQEYLSHIKGN